MASAASFARTVSGWDSARLFAYFSLNCAVWAQASDGNKPVPVVATAAAPKVCRKVRREYELILSRSIGKGGLHDAFGGAAAFFLAIRRFRKCMRRIVIR